MKFGIIIHSYGNRGENSVGYNAGDAIQSMAFEQIYRMADIPESEIVEIGLDELEKYDGEYLILPMYSMAIGIGFAPLPLSPKIIPVFISSHFAVQELSELQVKYLQTYQPIGCRDEFSLSTMHKYGIQAYLSGCGTIIFPKRSRKPDVPKALFIDTPQELERFIPSEISKRAQYISHMLPLQKKVMTKQDAQEYYVKTEQLLQYYADEATLVVSSRMHALVPCMAMGIPVIGAFDNISYRFSWLDKFIPLYGAEDFDKINWTPEPVEYEDIKQQVQQLFADQILAAYYKYKSMYELSDFYENRNKAVYANRYKNLINTAHSYLPEKFSYRIWGCGLIGNTAYDIMQHEFPQAKFLGAIDSFVQGVWHEQQIIAPQQIDQTADEFIILASYSGKDTGYEWMNRLGKKENKDFLYIATPNG